MTREMKNKVTRELKTGRIYKIVNKYGRFGIYVNITLKSVYDGKPFQMGIGVSPREVKAKRVLC